MRQRLLVMNGQRIVQIEQGGTWTNHKVDKARTIKPGIYNLYMSHLADKKQIHDGMIVHTDSNHVFQQMGKQFVMHAQSDFDKVPEIGSMKSISYSLQGKATMVDTEANKLTRGRSR